jgi:hypothetical protein
MTHALPFEPETTFRSGHRITLFIERFLLMRLGSRSMSP